MATGERDLTSQADTFLDKLLGDRVSDPQKRSLGEWLSSQLESERQGWKKKLQMSMKEIERERKMALEVHSAIHQMNSQLDSLSGPVQLFREPSMYQGSDKDMKTSHIQQLQKNIDAVTNMNRHLQKERLQCFSVLGVEETEQDLVPVTQGKVETLQEEVECVRRELKETEAKLVAEVEKLQGSLDCERRTIENDAQQIKQLRTIVDDFKGRSHGGSSHRKSKSSDVSVQVCLRKPTRECCIQTDFQSGNSRETGSNMPSPVTDVRITKSQPRKRDVMQISNVGNLDLCNLSARDSRSPPASGAPKQMELKRASRYARDFDSRNTDQKQTIDYLRGQVVNFSHQLEQTRQQVDQYQKQIAFMRTSPQKQQPLKEPTINLVPPVNPLLQTGNIRRWSSEGFLGGSKLSDREADVIFVHSKLKKPSPQGSNKMAVTGNASNNMATAKCLRCQKLYRLRDNHQGACTFHLKDRRKVERYDGAGKLLRMSVVWECCKENSDSLGCVMGQHV